MDIPLPNRVDQFRSERVEIVFGRRGRNYAARCSFYRWLWLWLVKPGWRIAASIARALLDCRCSIAALASSGCAFFVLFLGFRQFVVNALVGPVRAEELGNGV